MFSGPAGRTHKYIDLKFSNLSYVVQRTILSGYGPGISTRERALALISMIWGKKYGDDIIPVTQTPLNSTKWSYLTWVSHLYTRGVTC